MSHALIKATLANATIDLIAKNEKLSSEKAFEKYYKSAAPAILSDDETGMWGRSPLELLAMTKTTNAIDAEQPESLNGS